MLNTNALDYLNTGSRKAINLCFTAILALLISPQTAAESTDISFEQALQTVVSNDLVLESQNQEFRAAQLGIEATVSLPAPSLGLSINNLPVDSFAFDQEAMTQAMLSLSLMLPPKGLLSARGQSQQESANIALAKSELRHAQLRQILGNTWINGWQALSKSNVLSRHRVHFEQMSSAADASFRAGLGRTSQHNLLSLRSALSRLDSRAHATDTQLIVSRESLREWLNEEQIKRLNFGETPSFDRAETTHLHHDVYMHPELKLAESQRRKVKVQIRIADAMNGSNHTFKLSYGYRGDAPNGASRSDFLSIGMTMDLASLRGSANNSRVQSSNALYLQSESQYRLIERRLQTEYNSKLNIRTQLQKQLQLFKEEIIPQSVRQAESARSVYMSDEATFAEMQRSQINLMNAELDELEIEAQILRVNNTLQYISSKANNELGTTQ